VQRNIDRCIDCREFVYGWAPSQCHHSRVRSSDEGPSSIRRSLFLIAFHRHDLLYPSSFSVTTFSIQLTCERQDIDPQNLVYSYTHRKPGYREGRPTQDTGRRRRSRRCSLGTRKRKTRSLPVLRLRNVSLDEHERPTGDIPLAPCEEELVSCL